MENIIYNGLLVRGYNVDVVVVNVLEGDAKKQLEVDFACNRFNKKYYIQSTLSLTNHKKQFKKKDPHLLIFPLIF